MITLIQFTQVRPEEKKVIVRVLFIVGLTALFSECNCVANQTVANTTCDAESGQCDCSVSLAGGLYGGRQCHKCAKRTVGEYQTLLNWGSLVRF